jgi:hypothetical protein
VTQHQHDEPPISCAHCGSAIAAKADVVRSRWHRYHLACVLSMGADGWDEVPVIGACTGCGRRVRWAEPSRRLVYVWWRWRVRRGQRLWCSDACRRRVSSTAVGARPCQHCGVGFLPSRSRAWYCSATCQVAASSLSRLRP